MPIWWGEGYGFKSPLRHNLDRVIPGQRLSPAVYLRTDWNRFVVPRRGPAVCTIDEAVDAPVAPGRVVGSEAQDEPP